MPTVETSKKANLMATEKSLLLQIATRAPHPEALSVATLMHCVSGNDGKVSFSSRQAKYIVDQLIPWALEHFPFSEPREKLERQSLQDLSVALSAP